MPAEPYGAAATGPPTPLDRPGGRKGRQVGADGDRADARAAAAVRDAERLVQVEVRHVGAEPAGPARPTSAFRLAPST